MQPATKRLKMGQGQYPNGENHLGLVVQQAADPLLTSAAPADVGQTGGNGGEFMHAPSGGGHAGLAVHPGGQGAKAGEPATGMTMEPVARGLEAHRSAQGASRGALEGGSVALGGGGGGL